MSDFSDASADISMVPTGRERSMDFRDTSFFRAAEESTGRQLSLPEDVFDKWIQDGRPLVTRYEDLGMVVKMGRPQGVSPEEALMMRFARQRYPNGELPVPEVYGWRHLDNDEGQRVLIYMTLVDGQTLEQLWPKLDIEDKDAITIQLSGMLDLLRTTPRPSDPFVGSISKGPVRDRYLQDYQDDSGPFHDVAAFNDHIQIKALYWLPRAERSPEPYRSMLPDEDNICLTHGDVSLGNIMLCDGESGPPRISAIIDWEESGWHPEYWEYCKMHLSMPYWHEWRADGWVEKILAPRYDEFDALAEYWGWRGCL